ncbi:MAG: DUF692 domain-containing protein [Alcanivoracaceae bacterium]|nr:DUF692 domain-containing protein [Alcanivoracaceae bacterium]
MRTLNDLKNNAGVGLRIQHIQDILRHEIDGLWFEILADNWLSSDLNDYYLALISERYPITIHGVGLSLGSPQALDFDYLKSIKNLMKRGNAIAYSEHICFAQLPNDHFAHDLLPLPYCKKVLQHLVQRINQVQDYLGHQILLENVSSYLSYKHSEMTEAEFIGQLVQKSGCGLLLDINNLYVNQVNLGSSAEQTIKHMHPDWVQEIHLAGFETHTNFLIDAHNNPVCEQVWTLYQLAIAHLGNKATLIEWDNDIPSWNILLAERNKAQNILQKMDYQMPALSKVSVC